MIIDKGRCITFNRIINSLELALFVQRELANCSVDLMAD